MDKIFEEAFEEIIELEGGYVDDPDDRGGATKFGITEKTARNLGYEGDMRNLTRNDAKRMYYNNYWANLSYQKIENKELAIKLFDIAVNMGPGTANKKLQHAYNLLTDERIAEDGIIGPNTLAAVNDYEHQDSLLKLVNVLQGRKYVEICENDDSQKKFLRGWLRRVKL